MLKKVLSGLALYAASIAFLGAAVLEKAVFDDAELWNRDQKHWTKQFPKLLRPDKADMSKMSFYAAMSRGQSLTFYGEKIQEMNLEFENNKLKRIDISIYNRGDTGSQDIKYFNDQIKELTAKFNDMSTKQINKSSTMVGQSRLESLGWICGDKYAIQLKWSRKGNVPEFLKCSVFPSSEMPSDLKSDIKAEIKASDLKTKIKTDKDGNRYLDIPMVNQGAKGYCAAATIERVMNYYESSVDQHIIAQIASTDSNAGTNLPYILQELNKASSRLNVRLKKLYENSNFTGKDGFNRMISAYNSEARKAKKSQIFLDNFITERNGIRYLSTTMLFKAMDFESYKKSRLKEQRKYEEFCNDVKNNIDNGIPVVWAVVGMDPQMGYIQHMRIINGYSKDKKSIVYTDSYGVGHEKKIMPMDTAWTLTSCTLILTPRDK